MTAIIIDLPKQDWRTLAPVHIEFRAEAISKALGGDGELRGPPDRPGWRWYRCRCPLCGGVMRLANRPGGYPDLSVDCADGCEPDRIVAELMRQGHHRVVDPRRLWRR
jgi:hypothetical protein